MFFAVRPKAMPLAKAEPVQKLTVPVASSNLVEGRRITLGDIAIMKLTRAELKKRGITTSFMSNPEQIMGRVLRAPLKLGKPFLTDGLFPEGVGPGIAQKLRAGHRAVTVSVGGNDALLGFATAGSWIDVIFRSGETGDQYYSNDARYRNNNWGNGRSRGYRNGNAHSDEVTMTLIERVQILAIDTNTLKDAPDTTVRPDAEDRVSVTLAVTSGQAEKLRIVEGRGQLSLALRSAEDVGVQKEREQRTLDDILGRKNTVRQMEVYQGTRFERITFGPGGYRSNSGGRSRTAGGSGSKSEPTQTATVEDDKPRS